MDERSYRPYYPVSQYGRAIVKGDSPVGRFDGLNYSTIFVFYYITLER